MTVNMPSWGRGEMKTTLAVAAMPLIPDRRFERMAEA
jgi:hypothetical protein